jgi:hypothetical protein
VEQEADVGGGRDMPEIATDLPVFATESAENATESAEISDGSQRRKEKSTTNVKVGRLNRLLREIEDHNGKPTVEKNWTQHEVLQAFMSIHKTDSYWLNLEEGKIYQIAKTDEQKPNCKAYKAELEECVQQGFRAVSGPRSFERALADPKWGEPSRLERETLRSGPIVEVDEEIARKAIADGADLVLLFPVY